MFNSRTYSIISILGSIVISFGLLYVVSRETDVKSLFSLFQGTDRWGLLCFCILSLCGLAARALRYKFILSRFIPRDLPAGFLPYLTVTGIRNAVVDLLPARTGELIVLYIFKRYNITYLAGFSLLGVTMVFDIITLIAIVAVLGLHSVYSSASLLESVSGEFLIFLFLGFLILTLLLLRLRSIIRFLDESLRTFVSRKPTSIMSRAQKLSTELRTIFENFGGGLDYLILFGLTVLLRAIKYGSLYVLLAAVLQENSASIPLFISTTAFILAEASASLPMSGIMGFGSYEAMWTFVLSLAQTEIAQPLSVIFVVHLFSQLFAYLIGFSCFFLFGVREFKRPAS